MVTKTEDGFAIHVKVGTHPANDYVETVTDIVNSIQSQNPDLSTSNFYLLELLKEMLPTYEQAKAMFDDIKDV